MLLRGIEVQKLVDAGSEKVLRISCFLRFLAHLFASSTRQSRSAVVAAFVLIANALTFPDQSS